MKFFKSPGTRNVLMMLSVIVSVSVEAQTTYRDSIESYLEKYVLSHSVVTGENRKHLSFFPVDQTYRVLARFEPAKESKWFNMPTSGSISKTYRVYGYLHFTIRDTALKLAVYQAQSLMQREEYKNYLFLPFTDLSSGEDSYAVGRYLNLQSTDIVNNQILLDFNKAYNPYCAYVSGVYNCPIPPKENQLNVRIAAGEKNYKH